MDARYEIRDEWEEPAELRDLLSRVTDQRPDANVAKIRYAYYIAEKAHHGQKRASGVPYILHPLAVASIIVDLRLDDEAIVAALLHDVLEDCPDVKEEDLAKVFGPDVVHLVQGVTKLKFSPQGELTTRQREAAETNRTAEALRKMLLAMAQDFRVMVIKLADRLHNMSTLDALPPEKRTRIATETLNIFAPLAARLGIWQIKWQLEDLAFQALHPKEFDQVKELVAKTRKGRERDLDQVIVALKSKFEEQRIQIFDIRGRPKHLYSIFNKMVKQGIPFEEIYDLLALRIIVSTVADCYVVLGIVHESYVPVMALFYDYIGKPKPNGYKSLHTKVLGPQGEILEVQIRTKEMHEVAEHGVAAHWTYKEGKASLDETKRLSNLRQQLFDWSSDSSSSSEFLRTVSTDLFSEQVFVFTPKGDVIDLPKDSTPVDFAFRVHTKLGMTLVGAKINGAMVPLSTKLSNGDVCELINRSNAGPSLDWLKFVKSTHTRAKLRGHFRKLTKTLDAHRGRDALEKELKSLGLNPTNYLGEEKLNKVAESMDAVENGADVLAKVGAGLASVQSVISKLRGTEHEPVPHVDRIEVTKTREGKVTLVSSGLDNVLLNRARCCNPIPGDEVSGYVTRGRGIMIHRRVCPNVLAYEATEAERLVPYEWRPDGSVYSVKLKITLLDRRGALAEVTAVLSETKANVSAAKVKTMANQTAEFEASIDVTDTNHLSLVMNKVSNLQDVISILRMVGPTSR